MPTLHKISNRDEIVALIIDTLQPFRAGGESSDSQTVAIYGDGGMDSMGLVIFLAELEARLTESTGRDLVLANEKAMSRSHSPYRDVGTLADFVLEMLCEAQTQP